MGALAVQQQAGPAAGLPWPWGSAACGCGKGAPAGGGSPGGAAATFQQATSALARLAWRHARLVVLALALLAFLWVYLPCALLILWNYIWWILYSNTVQLARPGPTTGSGGGGGSGAPLGPYEAPRILHQTWKDAHVPEKWQAAQKSCIDAHPGYEYKLWTDEEALKVSRLDPGRRSSAHTAHLRPTETRAVALCAACVSCGVCAAAHRRQVPLVLPHVPRLPAQHPARRRAAVLCAVRVRRHLPGEGQRLSVRRPCLRGDV